MGKPDDIPQDVWDLAARFMERSYPHGAKEFAARAILAAKAEEREACARIADEEADELDGTDQILQSLPARSIAAAIRKRGEA